MRRSRYSVNKLQPSPSIQSELAASAEATQLSKLLTAMDESTLTRHLSYDPPSN